MKLRFTKMQGCGNDYIYLDCRTAGVPANIAALAAEWSARHFSVGADGIICICAPITNGADATMRIFNADGSEGLMCGNGIRCVAQWLRTHLLTCRDKEALTIDTQSGTKTMRYCGSGCWQVEMGGYTTSAAQIPAHNMGVGAAVGMPICAAGQDWRATCVNVGNPHCVVVVPEVASFAVAKIGPAFESHVNFPQRINTEFVQVVSPTHLKMRVWERGSGETYACGTGTCATVAAMVAQGICARESDVAVECIGGTLTIRITADDTIYMTGPAKTVFEGEIEV